MFLYLCIGEGAFYTNFSAMQTAVGFLVGLRGRGITLSLLLRYSSCCLSCTVPQDLVFVAVGSVGAVLRTICSCEGDVEACNTRAASGDISPLTAVKAQAIRPVPEKHLQPEDNKIERPDLCG